jgi:hypothetical protein
MPVAFGPATELLLEKLLIEVRGKVQKNDAMNRLL